MNNNEIQKELSRLTKRYADVGATEEKVLELFEAMKTPFRWSRRRSCRAGCPYVAGRVFPPGGNFLPR